MNILKNRNTVTALYVHLSIFVMVIVLVRPIPIARQEIPWRQHLTKQKVAVHILRIMLDIKKFSGPTQHITN